MADASLDLFIPVQSSATESGQQFRRNSSSSDGADYLTLDFSPFREPVHSWKKLPDCDEFVGARRSKHTMVAYKNGIFVFGGDNSKQMLNDVIRFDLSDYSWSRAFTMGTVPSPRYHHSAVVHDSSMFIFGGYTGDIHCNVNLTNKNDLFEYKFSTGQWSEIRSEGKLPPARSAHGAAVHDGKMWIFGGFDGHTRLNDMWNIRFDGPVRRWQEVQQCGECPPICCNFALTVIKDHAYLFSGQSGARSTNSLFQFHFPSRTWTKINTEHILRGACPPPPRRYGHTMVAHDKYMYVFGGAAENIHSADLHCYDLETLAWSIVKHSNNALAKTPSCRLFHATVVVGDAMFVFGGTVDNNVRSSEMFRFQFATYPRCTLHNDFSRLLKSREFCDLRFFVGENADLILAHIAVVAARSAYLCAKIKQTKEQVDTLERNDSSKKESNFVDVYIADVEPVAFQLILDYIYTDKIDPTFRCSETTSNDIVLLMMDVYRLALKFSMKRLETLCVQYLESMIGFTNVLIALQNASRLNLTDIKDFCLKFIIRDGIYPGIVMSKAFEKLEQPLMVEVIRKQQTPSVKSTSEVVHNQSVTLFEGSTLADDFKAFLESGSGAEFCDVTLICGETSFPAHKVILAARSGYFETFFRSWMPENNCVKVALGEIVPSPQAFHSLLRFVYYGCTSMPPEDSLYLLAAPQFYVFTNNRLQIFCKENLETSIRQDNVFEILEAADKLQAVEMKRHALKLVVSDFSKMASLPKLKTLSRELLLDIIEALADGVREPTTIRECSSVCLEMQPFTALQ